MEAIQLELMTKAEFQYRSRRKSKKLATVDNLGLKRLVREKKLLTKTLNIKTP